MIKIFREEYLFNIFILIFTRIVQKIYGMLISIRVNGGKSITSDSFGSLSGGKNIYFGTNIHLGKNTRIQAISRHRHANFMPRVNLGNNICINDYFHLGACYGVEIKSGCLIGSHVTIIDHNHEINPSDNNPLDKTLIGKPIVIEENVWLADHVIILPGVTIGKGAVVGAGSIVNKDVKPYTIVVGSPAREIKKII